MVLVFFFLLLLFSGLSVWNTIQITMLQILCKGYGLLPDWMAIYAIVLKDAADLLHLLASFHWKTDVKGI